MTEPKILGIFGTRPEAIKMAPVIHELINRADQVCSYVCVTAQHREMLDQVLEIFSLTPDFDLNIMQQGQTPSQVAARVLLELETLLQELKLDWVLVQGDTTTVMAASIAAHHNRIRVAHVEAGLRTHDRANPFPEEMNRVVTDHVSDMHFAPTRQAQKNLLNEGISKESIFITGNTGIDALHWVTRQPPPAEITDLMAELGISPESRGERQSNGPKSLILVTAHRRENFGQPIKDICLALKEIALRTDVALVYPVHRNPNIWEPVHDYLENVDHIKLLAPLDYISLAHLMKNSRLILTDSGGIQEEAPSFGVPVLVLRETTERPEAIEAGVARLVGTCTPDIVSQVNNLLDDPKAYAKMAQTANPFGDGQASRRIVDILINGETDEFHFEK